MCVILGEIKRNPTPNWMAKRLTQVEMNIHDAAIDITNYVTHELGHPCHAFDYDKLMATGGEIHIVEAKAGEKFSTLDGESFVTLGGEVVFKNSGGEIIDLPSIKGTANTSVDQSTKNILLLLESIIPEKVRFASMTHAIRTTAAQLMEKGVDPHLMSENIKFGIKLYEQLCEAQVKSEIYDDFSGDTKPQPVKIKRSTIENYLGIKLVNSGKPKKTQLALGRVEEILEQLGCQVKIVSNSPHLLTQDYELTVTPPTHRPDLQIPADIIEEIARIYGYHNLPSVIMPGVIPLKKQPGVDFKLEGKIKHFLADLSWQEAYTYSMVSEELALQSGFKLAEHLKLQNPLGEDKVYLRRSLIPSLIEFVENNPLEHELSIFELANLYSPQKNDLPAEALHLSLVSKRAYRQVKGDLEALLDKLYVTNYRFEPSEKLTGQFTQLAEIQVFQDQQWQLIGQLGVLKDGLIAAGIAMAKLIPVVQDHPTYQPIPKTTPIIEDLTFTLTGQTRLYQLLQSTKALHKLINLVTLKDVYRQNYTFTIEYLDPQANLSVEQIAPIRKQIVELVETKFNGKLIGNI